MHGWQFEHVVGGLPEHRSFMVEVVLWWLFVVLTMLAYELYVLDRTISLK